MAAMTSVCCCIPRSIRWLPTEPIWCQFLIHMYLFVFRGLDHFTGHFSSAAVLSWKGHNLVFVYTHHGQNKTAELSQRRPRDAPNIWMPWKVLRVLTMHPATFPEICNGLLLRTILRMCIQKLKFVALPVPEIIGGTPKIWAVPVYAHAPFSPKFLIVFCLHGTSEYICQIWCS